MSKSDNVIIIENDKIKYIFTGTTSKFTIVNLDSWKFDPKDLVRLHPVTTDPKFANVKTLYSEATHTKPIRRKTSAAEKRQLASPLNSGHFFRAFELGLVNATDNASRNPEDDKDFTVLAMAVITSDEELNSRLIEKLKQLWLIGYEEFAKMEQLIVESRTV